MKNGAFVLPIIFAWCSLVLAEPSKSTTEVLLSPIGIQLRSGDNFTCDKPSEEKGGDFRNCSSTSGKFPSHVATCQCTRCTKTLSLTCRKDLKWYPTISNSCNESAGCKPSPVEKCNFNIRPKNLICNETNGHESHENDTVSCVCKDICQQVSLRCDKDGTWHPQGRTCNETTNFSNSSTKLQYSIKEGTYNYSCSTGFNLVGNKTRHCNQGKLNGTEPQCVKQGRKTESQNEEDPEAGTFPLDLVLIGIGCSLAAIALVLGLYFGVRSRRRRQHRQAVDNAQSNPACQEAQQQDYMSMNELYVSFNAEFNNVRNK